MANQKQQSSEQVRKWGRAIGTAAVGGSSLGVGALAGSYAKGIVSPWTLASSAAVFGLAWAGKHFAPEVIRFVNYKWMTRCTNKSLAHGRISEVDHKELTKRRENAFLTH